MSSSHLYLGLSHDIHRSPRLPDIDTLASHTGMEVVWTATPDAVHGVIAALHQSIHTALHIPSLSEETRTDMHDMAKDLQMRFDPLAESLDQLYKTIARTLRFVQNLSREAEEFTPLQRSMESCIPYLVYTRSPRLPAALPTSETVVIDHAGIDTVANIVSGVTNDDVLRMARITTGKVYLLLAEETKTNKDPAHRTNMMTLQSPDFMEKYAIIDSIEQLPRASIDS